MVKELLNEISGDPQAVPFSLFLLRVEKIFGLYYRVILNRSLVFLLRVEKIFGFILQGHPNPTANEYLKKTN